jgi:FlaA1/EpsC-like NDP-sugar epimerase
MTPQSLPSAARAPKPRPAAWSEHLKTRRDLALRLIHAMLIATSTAAAWGLSVALSGELPGPEIVVTAFGVLIAAKTTAAELFRLHRASWRWFGLPDAAAITVANTSGSVLAALALGPRVATSAMAAILIIEWLASQGLLLGSRMLFRLLREASDRSSTPPRRRVLIYGAGRRGVNLLRQIRANPFAVYEIAGFIDDDPEKRHRMVQMNPVLGNGDELPRLAELHEIDEILIAVGPQASERRGRFRDLARLAGLPFRFPRRAGNATPRRRAPAACAIEKEIRL